MMSSSHWVFYDTILSLEMGRWIYKNDGLCQSWHNVTFIFFTETQLQTRWRGSVRSCNRVDNREIQPKACDAGKTVENIFFSIVYKSISVYYADEYCLHDKAILRQICQSSWTCVTFNNLSHSFSSNNLSLLLYLKLVRSQLNQVVQYIYEVSRDWKDYSEIQLLSELSSQGFHPSSYPTWYCLSELVSYLLKCFSRDERENISWLWKKDAAFYLHTNGFLPSKSIRWYFCPVIFVH